MSRNTVQCAEVVSAIGISPVPSSYSPETHYANMASIDDVSQFLTHPMFQPGGMMYDTLAARRLRGTRCVAFVNSTLNPSIVKKGTIMYAAHKLIQAFQREFDTGEIAIPSQDIKDSRKGVEIAVMFNPFKSPKQKSLVTSVTDFLSNKAEELGLPFRKFVMQPDASTSYYTEEQLQYVSKFDKKIEDDPQINEQYFEDLASEIEEERSNMSKRKGIGSFSDVPKEQNTAALPLQKEKLAGTSSST
jgi:hypothetical protein